MGKKYTRKKHQKQQHKIYLLTESLARLRSLLEDFNYHYDVALNRISSALIETKSETDKRRILNDARYGIAGHHIDICEALYEASEHLSEENDSKPIRNAARNIEKAADKCNLINEKINKKEKILDYMDRKLHFREVRKARNQAAHPEACFTGVQILMLRHYTFKALVEASSGIGLILKTKYGYKYENVFSFQEIQKVTEARERFTKNIEKMFRDFLDKQTKNSEGSKKVI